MKELFHEDDVLAGQFKNINQAIFQTILAALIHDFKGNKSEANVGAQIDKKLAKKFLDELEIPQPSINSINKLVSITDYDNSKNAVFFSYDGETKFENEQINIFELILVTSDLLQIGAIDYKNRVKKDLGIENDKLPIELLEITSKSLKLLESNLECKLNTIFPNILRNEVLSLFN